MVGPNDVKRNGNASVGYWVQYITLTFYLTPDLDLGCFKVKFRNSSISGIVGLIDVKWKRSELIWYWADCMNIPLDHTNDLDPGVEILRSKSEIALSQEWDGRLTWTKRMWVIHSWPWYWLVWPWWVGRCTGYSDWGDFRRRRAVDISSLIYNVLTNVPEVCSEFY